MTARSKGRAGRGAGSAAGQRDRIRATYARTATSKKAAILPKKDAARRERRERGPLRDADYAPPPGSLQALLLGTPIGDVAAVIQQELLQPARIRQGRSDHRLQGLLQRVAQAAEAYRFSDNQRRLGMLASLGAQPPADPDDVERLFINAIFALPEEAVVGRKGVRNARNRRSAYLAALRGARLLGVSANDVAATFAERKEGIAGVAEVAYAASRSPPPAPPPEEHAEPAEHFDPGTNVRGGEEEAPRDDGSCDPAPAPSSVGSTRPRKAARPPAGLPKPEGKLIRIRVGGDNEDDLDGEWPVVCLLVPGRDELWVRAAVKLYSAGDQNVHGGCERLLGVLGRMPSAPEPRRPAPGPARKPRKPGGHHGRR